MAELMIRLPDGSLHTRTTINHCQARIKRFVERDAYVPYDYWIRTVEKQSDLITDNHVYAMNSAMFARSSRAAWATITGRPIEELREIPAELDLIDGRDDEVRPAITA